MLKGTKKKYSNPDKKKRFVADIDNCSLKLQFYSNGHYLPLSLLFYPKDVNADLSDHGTPIKKKSGQQILDKYMLNLPMQSGNKTWIDLTEGL